MRLIFKNSRVWLLAILSAAVLTSCITPKTKAQALYLIESDYAAALTLEVKYDSLPTCGTANAPILCKDADVAKTVRKVDDMAWIAISEAQKAVRQGAGEDKLATLLSTATSAVEAFKNIVATLGVK